MINSTHEWLSLLKQASPMLGIPLLAAGAGLMIFGWRLSRVCVALTFAVVGYLAGHMIWGHVEGQQSMPWIAAAGLALVALAPVSWGIALAGGLGASALLFGALKGFGLTGPALWVAAGVVLFGATALSAIQRRYVVIVLSSLEGSILMLSGLTAMAISSGAVYNTVKGMASSSGIVAPFMLLVPTVVSFFYQVSDVRRVGAEI